MNTSSSSPFHFGETGTDADSWLLVIREIALHSEAEEVGVYNVLEEKGFAQESKEFRDEHEQLENSLLG